MCGLCLVVCVVPAINNDIPFTTNEKSCRSTATGVNCVRPGAPTPSLTHSGPCEPPLCQPPLPRCCGQSQEMSFSWRLESKALLPVSDRPQVLSCSLGLAKLRQKGRAGRWELTQQETRLWKMVDALKAGERTTGGTNCCFLWVSAGRKMNTR